MNAAFFASIPDTATIAVSRLVDHDIWNDLIAGGHEIVEVPHVRCEPVEAVVDAGALRLRCWPNLGGRLEGGSSEDLVAWFPTLARRPDRGTVVPMTLDGDGPIDDRVRFLHSLLKQLSQISGVAGACRPQAPRTIVYTPGFDRLALTELSDRYPGSLTPTPRRLAEFPGGVCITITAEVWSRTAAFTRDLTSFVRG